jgi:transposase
MYTVRDLMNRFGVTQHTVLGWIARGELAALNVGRSPNASRPRWRITAAALEKFEGSRTSTSPAPAAAPRRRRRERDDVINFY